MSAVVRFKSSPSTSSGELRRVYGALREICRLFALMDGYAGVMTSITYPVEAQAGMKCSNAIDVGPSLRTGSCTDTACSVTSTTTTA